MITVKSTIDLTEEQVKEALISYLLLNNIRVGKIHNIREKTSDQRNEMRVGFILEVEQGGSNPTTFRGDPHDR